MQTEQRNSLRLLQWMMAASLALPLALFIFASAVSWISVNETADREIDRTLDVAHEHALKVFETIDRSLSEINEIIRGIPDDGIRLREAALHLRLKQLVASLPQLKSTWIFDAKGRALVNSLVSPAARHRFFRPRLFQGACRRRYRHLYRRGADAASALSGRGVLRRQPAAAERDGSFAGVIQASVYPEYFENFYARIGRDPGSFFALGRTDGVVLARFPAARPRPSPRRSGRRQEAGRQSRRRPVHGDLADRRNRAPGRLQRLAEYPIYVSAGLDTSAIRARWFSTMSQHLVFGLPATALLFLASASRCGERSAFMPKPTGARKPRKR